MTSKERTKKWQLNNREAYLASCKRTNAKRDKNKAKKYRKSKLEDMTYRINKNTKHKEWQLKLKTEVFAAYGGPICVCCNEQNFEFMCIDHINGDGNKHRRSLGKNGKQCSGTNFYSWLRKNNFPTGFRVLCHNCNFSFGANGFCPHEKSFQKLKETIIASLVLQ